MRAPTFHADFLTSVIAKKSTLPRNWSEEIDILLKDFNADSSLVELTETLLSVAVAIVKHNSELRDEEIKKKVCANLKFVIQAWAAEQSDGQGGAVDQEMFLKVRDLAAKNSGTFGFTVEELAETFDGELLVVREAFGKLNSTSGKVDKEVDQRRLLIAQLYADKIEEVLSKFDSLTEAFALGDKIIDELVYMSDEQLTNEKLVLSVMVRVVQESYGKQLEIASIPEA